MAPRVESESHVALVRSDGEVVAFGSNRQGQCQVPPLPSPSLRFVAASAGGQHTVVLRSDGVAIAVGANDFGQCDVPQLPARGLKYVAAAAGCWHTILVRNDGAAVAFGRRSEGQCRIPPLESPVRYVGAAAGWFHSILIRSDGSAVAFGENEDDQCWVPPLPPFQRYLAAAAGRGHSIYLRSDGSAVAAGFDAGDGRCNVPALPQGRRYMSVAAGRYHTVLVRSDGEAVAFGRSPFEDRRCAGGCEGGRDRESIAALPPEKALWTNKALAELKAFRWHDAIASCNKVIEYSEIVEDGFKKSFQATAFGIPFDTRCQVPPLPQIGEIYYIAAFAGWRHTVLVRSDGRAVAVGCDEVAEAMRYDSAFACRCLPGPPLGLRYTAGMDEPPEMECVPETPAAGMCVLGEGRGGEAGQWESLGRGAWQRVPQHFCPAKISRWQRRAMHREETDAVKRLRELDAVKENVSRGALVLE